MQYKNGWVIEALAKRWTLASLLICLVAPTNVSANGIAENLEVDFVRVDSSGYGYVNFVSALTSTPATCINGYPNALAFDTNTAGGKAIYTIALVAKTTNKRIRAVGTNNCTIYGSIESWSWGKIMD